jgi:hypothetical protein
MDAALIDQVKRKYYCLAPEMDERRLRQWAAAEARELGYGGVAVVSNATGLSRPTIYRGIRELEMPLSSRIEEGSRIRKPGAGRRPLIVNDPDLIQALEALVDPVTRGDPESPLRWTCKSTRKLAQELTRLNHPISERKVAQLLHEAGYSLQANSKQREGGSHPDRNTQFEFINTSVKGFLRRHQPAISVDTKKKELVGDFKNAGREWRPQGCPEFVRVHDFLDKYLGKAIPYGVYDILNDQGWINVGIDHDTAKFATNSIRQWWTQMGQQRFPNASELLITADGGGSNSSRSRLWKVCLQELANELGLKLTIRHFPPGTSKWNKIEHRLFSFISQNWRGKPLISHQAIINLIASTTTKSGLIVKAAIDTNQYPTKIKVTDNEFAQIKLHRSKFHGEWNYTIAPKAIKL